jgi:hypothetical protein
MRTTIDLPEDLLRRAKATAALRGIKMKDLIAELVGFGLEGSSVEETSRYGMNCPIPVIIPAKGRNIPILTNAQIFEFLDREDDEMHGRLP